MAEQVKISANLPKVVVDALKSIADQQGVSMTEALRRAISTEKFLIDATADKSKILIEGKDKKVRQLVLR